MTLADSGASVMNLSKISAVATLFTLALLSPEPASAGRTVIDGGATLSLSGYCSPMVAASPGGCAPVALPFSAIIGAATFNSVYVNSNGTLSFITIAPQLALQNSFTGEFATAASYTGPPPATSLGAFPAPIFSPNLSDGPGFAPPFASIQGFDGNYASTQSATANSLTVNFFACTDTIRCGTETIRVFTNAIFDPDGFDSLTQLILSYNPAATLDLASFEIGRANALAQSNASLNIYTITLTGLGDGFMVDYSYNQGALGDIGTSGFNLASGLNETNAPLVNRSFRFTDGQLVSGAVPEPATWLTMLLGFGAVGFALRRRKAGIQPKAA